jgi:sugar phosphate isomerase/epimerase
MRFGCFTTEIGRIGAMADMGFDYVELGFRVLAPLEDEAAATAAVDRILAAPLRAEALSAFIPPFVGLAVVGPAVDRAALRRYSETMLTRAAQVGAKVVTVGMARSRTIPEGFPPQRARDQFRDFLGLVTDLGTTRGITVGLEALNREETNLINTIPESLEMLREVSRPSLRLTIDYYHLFTDGEPLGDVELAEGLVGHIHTADAGRRPPGTEGNDQLALLQALSSIGYDDRLSIECRFTDFDSEAAAALEHLRGLWARASSE